MKLCPHCAKPLARYLSNTGKQYIYKRTHSDKTYYRVIYKGDYIGSFDTLELAERAIEKYINVTHLK